MKTTLRPGSSTLHPLPTQQQDGGTSVQSGRAGVLTSEPADLGAIVAGLRGHVGWLRGQAATELARADRGGCADRVRRHEAQAAACDRMADEVEASVARLEHVLARGSVVVEQITRDVMRTLGGAR